jgi:elongation factor Ts
MPEIDSKLVKQLRDQTNAGMMDCKKALEEAKGDLEQAVVILRKKGIAGASKKASRTAKEGLVASYIHLDRVGVLIEVNCETDFVAKNDNFREFVRDLTLHIAAAQPTYVSREQVPTEVIEREKEIAREQASQDGKGGKGGKAKKPEVIEKIIAGKLDKFFASVCLLDQDYIKENDKKVSDLVKSKIAEIGENIVIRRFARFAVGEGIDDEASDGES